MTNTFTAWLLATSETQNDTYNLKLVTERRNGSTVYTFEQLVDMQVSMESVVLWHWIGSIVVTARCGCQYRFEKTEHHAEYMCDTHWVRSVFAADADVNGDYDYHE